VEFSKVTQEGYSGFHLDAIHDFVGTKGMVTLRTLSMKPKIDIKVVYSTPSIDTQLSSNREILPALQKGDNQDQIYNHLCPCPWKEAL